MPIVPYREIDHDSMIDVHFDLPMLGGSSDALATLQAEDKERAREKEEAVKKRGWKIGFSVTREETKMGKPTKYVIELSAIANCVDDDDAEAIGQAAVKKLTGNRLTSREAGLLERIEEATVANVDSDFLRDAA